MLKEIKKVRQNEEEGTRKWYLDDYFDLIIWFDDQQKLSGFQLCYDKVHNERSLTWAKKTGFSHNKVDNGDLSGRAKMTPILVADGLFDNQKIADLFRSRKGELSDKMADFIYRKLLEADVN